MGEMRTHQVVSYTGFDADFIDIIKKAQFCAYMDRFMSGLFDIPYDDPDITAITPYGYDLEIEGMYYFDEDDLDEMNRKLAEAVEFAVKKFHLKLDSYHSSVRFVPMDLGWPIKEQVNE